MRAHKTIALTGAGLLTAAALLVGCASQPQTPGTRYKDGEHPIPADYRSWPKFLSSVERPDVKQIREIYLNPVGHRARRGESFPSGTVSVMEIYAATPGPDGKLVKGALSKVFLMAKGTGWGQGVELTALRNGDWVYAAYEADASTPATKDFAPCRTCHLPLADKDFVARYDEYFDFRR